MTILSASTSVRASLREASLTDEGSPAKPIVVLDNVRKVYPGRRASLPVNALDGISLSVNRGEIVGVIGRSGAGKSTLIRLVNGLEKPTSGTVRVDKTTVSGLDERHLRQARRSIGMIFQHFNLLSSRTAYGNVALPLEIAGIDRSRIAERVRSLLDLVGLADKTDRYPAELSGGQKQRVGIARALATNPAVLLSDEATSALDPETTGQILSLIKQVNRQLGLTVLLITHEMAVVKSVADRVVVLEAGRIVEHGPTFDIFAHPNHPTTQSFVSSVTGSRISAELARRLRPDRFPGSQAVLKIVWTGDQSVDHVLSHIARSIPVDFNLLHGQIDSIDGRPFGALAIGISGDEATLQLVLHEFAQRNLRVEVLGHVA